jgi:ankyrin repeat protein
MGGHEEVPHMSLGELETKRLSLPYLETIQYVHLALERRGIVDDGKSDASKLVMDAQVEDSAKKPSVVETVDEEDDDIFLGMKKRPIPGKAKRRLNFDDSFGNAPVFDPAILRKRYPLFGDQLDKKMSNSVRGEPRQHTWVIQLIEEIYDARYMYEVDELNSGQKSNGAINVFAEAKEAAIDMSKSIRRMQRHKKSALSAYADFLPPEMTGKNSPAYSREKKRASKEAEISDETSKEPALSFPIFVFMYLSKIFGLKILVQQTAWDLLYNLEALKEDYPEINSFSLYLREIRDIDTTLFFLHCREIIQNRFSVIFKTKEKVPAPHFLPIKTLATVSVPDGQIMIFNHPKLEQVRMKKVFLTHSALVYICESIFADGKLATYVSEQVLGPFFVQRDLPTNEVVQSAISEFVSPRSPGNTKVRCIDTVVALEQLVVLFEETPDEIVNTAKYGDDSEAIAMLGKLKQTSENKAKLDKLEVRIENLKRRVQEQEVKVSMLKIKNSEGNKRTLLFLEENELWRRQQAVLQSEKDYQSLFKGNDEIWTNVLDDRTLELKRLKSNTKKRQSLVPWKHSVYVGDSLQRFEIWVKEKHRKWAMTAQVLKFLGKTWEEQLEELKLKVTILIQRKWRERVAARKAQKKAQERLDFEREERRKRNERRKNAELALKRRREREKKELGQKMDAKRKKEEDEARKKEAKRRRLHQNSSVQKKVRKLQERWKRERFDRWLLFRRSARMKLQRFRELLQFVMKRWFSKVELKRMLIARRITSATKIQGAWRVYMAKNALRFTKARMARNEQKVREFSKKMKYGQAIKIFRSWRNYTQKMYRVKSFMNKHFGMLCHGLFKAWRLYTVEWIEKRRISAIKIQNAWRRKQGIATYLKKKIRRDAAMDIQRSWRSYCAKTVLKRVRAHRKLEEEKVAKSLLKLKYKQAILALDAWHTHTDKMKRMRRLIDHGLRNVLVKAFEGWAGRFVLERDAAITIQGLWRRYAAHIHVTQMLLVTRKATIIEKYWRRYSAVLAVGKLRLYRISSANIQRTWRGYSGRVFYHHKRVERLLEAVRNKDYDAVEEAFKKQTLSGRKGRPILGTFEGHLADSAGRTALMVAALVGSKRIVKLCLRNKMDINQRDYSGRTALHYLTEGGYVGDNEIAEYMIIKGADRNARDMEGRTPIMDAATRERTDVLKLLIELGAVVDRPDNHGQTPLHVAAVSKRSMSVNILLRAKANVLSYDNTGCCVLHDICNRGLTSILEMMLPFARSVNTQDNAGMTPLMHAVVGQHYDCVHTMMWAHCDLEVVDNEGQTALHHAAQVKNPAITRLLTEGFANTDAVDKNGETPLHLSCREGDVENAKLLLGSGADWSMRDWRGNYPIHVAAEEGHGGIVHLLISYEVEVNVLNYDQKTPLGLARLVPHYHIIEIIEDKFLLESEVAENQEKTAASLLGIALVKKERDDSRPSLLDSVAGRFLRDEWQNRLKRSKLLNVFAEYEEYVEIADEGEEKREAAEGHHWWRNIKTDACMFSRPDEIYDEGNWEPVRVQIDGRWTTVKYENKVTGEVHDSRKPPTAIKTKRVLQQRPTLEADKGDLSLVDYKAFFEKEKAELDQQLLERDSAVMIEKWWRGYSARCLYATMQLRHHSAINIQRVARGWSGRIKAKNWRRQIEVATDLQRIFRGCSTRKSIQRILPILKRRRSVAKATVLINRHWRGYLARRELRRMRWKLYWGPQTDAQWRVMRKEGSYLRREVHRWEERIVDQTYDVIFYVDKFKLKCQWDKPAAVERYDDAEREEALELRLWGFTKAQERVATRLQAIWRGRQMAKTFRIMVKAKKLMNGSDIRYLNDPDSIENLCNYMMHLTCFPPHEYSRARILYSKALEYMLNRGPDNAFILFAYAIFVSSTREEDDLSIVDYVRRARLRPNYLKQFELAEKGFYRMAAIWHPEDPLCQHLYALCLQWAVQDYEKAEEFYIRAMELTKGRDKIITANFNYMLSKLKCVDYDAEDVMRKRALEVAAEETQKWMDNEAKKKKEIEEIEDLAARSLQFRWRLRQLGLLEYWPWHVFGGPTLKKPAPEVEENDKGKVPLLVDIEAFDDPMDWEICGDGYGGTYYFNISTEESQWEKPKFRDPNVQLNQGPGFDESSSSRDAGEFDETPEDWEICDTTDGGKYYYNTATGESRWRRPRFQQSSDYSKITEGFGMVDHFAKMELQVSSGNLHGDWEPVKDVEGRNYYWNRISGESTWTAPPKTWEPNYKPETVEEELPALPAGWEECPVGDGTVYYYNTVSGESVWERPVGQSESTEQETSAAVGNDSSVESVSNEASAWQECDDGYGNMYYYNEATGESNWEKPV